MSRVQHKEVSYLHQGAQTKYLGPRPFDRNLHDEHIDGVMNPAGEKPYLVSVIYSTHHQITCPMDEFVRSPLGNSNSRDEIRLKNSSSRICQRRKSPYALDVSAASDIVPYERDADKGHS